MISGLVLIPVCNNGRIPSPVVYWPWNAEMPWLVIWTWVVPRAPHHPETVFILHMPVKFYVFFVISTNKLCTYAKVNKVLTV